METEDNVVEITSARRNWKASVKKHWKVTALVTTLVAVEAVLLVRFRQAALATMAAEKELVETAIEALTPTA